MRLKKCKRCSKEYETAKQGTYLCPDCSDQARKESVYRMRVCTVCGSNYMGYPRSCYCDICRKAVNRERSRVFKANKAVRPLGSTDHCQKCGKEYIVCSGVQKYCKECADSAVSETIKAHKREYNRSINDTYRPYINEMRKGTKICVICGNTITTPTATITCSPECDRERRRRMQAKADAKRRKTTTT